MANPNGPIGLKPINRSITSGPLTPVKRNKVVGYATRIRAFDVVNRVADGSIERSITPGTTILTGVSLNYGAASVATEHQVITDPFQLYKAQGGGATGFAAADVALNANIVLGSTKLKHSDDYVNDGTEATGATLDLRIEELLSTPSNEVGGYVKIIVRINSGREVAGVAGV